MPFWSRGSGGGGGSGASEEKDFTSSSDRDAPSSTSTSAAPIGDGVVGESSAANDAASVSTRSVPAGEARDNAIVSEYGKWTKMLPEAYGIRQAVEDSPLRWCVRDSGMWAVATGTMMGM